MPQRLPCCPGHSWLRGQKQMRIYVRIACQAEETDAVLLDLVAPLMHRLWQEGLIRRGFFIRYHEGGHHLRVRFCGTHLALCGPVRSLIDASLQAYVAPRQAEPGPVGMNTGMLSYEYQRYEPEVERYGGSLGLRISEDHFAASSAIALSVLATERAGRGSRQSAALVLLRASAQGFQMGSGQRAESFEQFYLRRMALAWRTPPSREGLQQLVPVDPSAARGRTLWWPLSEQWQGSIARTYQALCHLQEQGALSTSLPALLSAYIHMLCNRLGIYPREETCLCYLLAQLYADQLSADPE